MAKRANRNNNHRDTNARTYLSFFSGILGLDLGFEKAGLRCAALNEINRVACATIRANSKRVFDENQPKLYDCDIRELTPKTFRDDLGIEPGELFAIIGGPPCQAFSTAGRRLGLNDDRGNVFLHFIHLVGQLQPKYAVFENVRGLLSSPLVHRPHNERGTNFPPLSEEEQPKGALSHILKLLKKYGYTTTFNLYNTANFGVPQVRERLVFFASRDDHEVPYLVPTHSQHGPNGLPKWKNLEDAIGKLVGKPCEAAVFPERRLKYYRLLKEGENWRNLPPHLQKKAMGMSWFAGGGKTGFYRRLAWKKPSPTLVTSPAMPATDLCHPSELRPLSVEEYAAIQTFPRWFKFEGKLADKYRQLGNAVPCHFGSVVAQHLVAFDENRLGEEGEAVRFSRYSGTDHRSWLSASL